MKTSTKLHFTTLFWVVVVVTLSNCSNRVLEKTGSTKSPADVNLSSKYNNFEGGVLFPDIKEGLDVLWRASFIKATAYKENLGFFVEGGLLIAPNCNNKPRSARVTALPTQVIDGKLFVLSGTLYVRVLGIIHTHPDVYSRPMPSPRADYPFAWTGIHSYVMDTQNLFDAYHDRFGDETYERLGDRDEYGKIPFAMPVLATN